MTVVLDGLPEHAEVKFPDELTTAPAPGIRYGYTTDRKPVRVQLSALGFDSRELTIEVPKTNSNNRVQVDARLRPSSAFTNSAGIRMKLIESGTFTMGVAVETPPGEQPDKTYNNPEREVTITQPFYIGAEEVTVGQFRLFVTSQGYVTEARAWWRIHR